MTENPDGRPNPGEKTMEPERSERPGEEIIELSEMTVGISPEDEAIIDLTEEIVDGAFAGYSGATGKIDAEAEMLDLSGTNRFDTDAVSATVGASLEFAAGEGAGAVGNCPDAAEADIAKDLDTYFQTEDEPAGSLPEAPSGETVMAVNLTPDQFDAALERVIRKRFGEKIDQILNEVIERTVSAEIETLKELLEARQD